MAASAFFSYRQNLTGDKAWFFATWSIGLIPFWAVISRYSKNLVWDGALYDSLVTVVYFVTLSTCTGKIGTMVWYQYIGFAMMVFGAVLLKKGF